MCTLCAVFDDLFILTIFVRKAALWQDGMARVYVDFSQYWVISLSLSLSLSVSFFVYIGNSVRWTLFIILCPVEFVHYFSATLPDTFHSAFSLSYIQFSRNFFPSRLRFIYHLRYFVIHKIIFISSIR
uniref:Uncharacterized protein n=1 Tax=Glypta fumiferanae TaxID=389681 RepID=A0A0F6Y970_9HYME|nr:hypothetical protein [Glypta fumiferanae]